MKRTNKILQEVVYEKIHGRDGNVYRALPFVPKDSERYGKLVRRFWEWTEKNPPRKPL